MASTNYNVVIFHRRRGKLVGAPPIKASDYIAAIGEAQLRVQDAAGALVFARNGKSEIEIIFKTGDVPDDVPGVYDSG
jgi:hypothetical protein